MKKKQNKLRSQLPCSALKKPWKFVTTSPKSRTKMSPIYFRQPCLSSLEQRKNTIGNEEHLSCSILAKMGKRTTTWIWIRNKRRIQKPWRWNKGKRELLKLLIALLSWFWWHLLPFTLCFLMISEARELVWHLMMCFMDCLVLQWHCLLWRSSFQAMRKISISIRFSFGLT